MSAPQHVSWRADGQTSARLPYIPALDGLRALAVVAVLLYHADLTWFRGGFLGVDVFFVLSGYLITCVLLAARRNTGSLGLRRFWLNRARRLLPALFVMLAVTCAYATLVLPHEVAKLRDDVLAALGYVTNWHLVVEEQSYFDAAGRPSLVQHLWSLAVEEQFYLVWPLLLGVGLMVLGRRRGRLALAVLAGAGASTLLMAFLYQPYTDPSRVYYGTDTHGMGLLLGAALALAWPPWRLNAKPGPGAPALLNVAGLAGVVGLVWCFENVDEFSPGLYRGGYLLVSLLAGLVVAVAVHPTARSVKLVLGNAPLRWIGERSYGIYLWHWPVYQVTRPGLDVSLRGFWLLALRIAITVALAALSYRFVEAPIRAGAIGRSFAALRATRPHHRRRVRFRFAFVGTVAAVSGALVAAGMAGAEPAPRPPGFEEEAVRIDVTTTRPSPTTTTTPSVETTVPPETVPPTVAPAPVPITRVTAIGDSVMLGARGGLEGVLGPTLQLDASVSRQFDDALEIAGLLTAANQLGDRVVLHLGNNGIIRPEQFDQMMQMLAAVPRVVVLNVNVPRPWDGPVNQVLAEAVPRYPNAVLVDWKSTAVQHPELFIDDGIHLKPEGAAVYADLIARSL